MCMSCNRRRGRYRQRLKIRGDSWMMIDDNSNISRYTHLIPHFYYILDAIIGIC